jgi:hypothetical protein
MTKFSILISFLFIGQLFSQTTFNLSGMEFHQKDEIPNSDTFLKFNSNSSAVYTMTGKLVMSGKSFRDECPCSVKVSGNQISINCTCSDKEIYPDPIKDSFTYNSTTKTLTSTSYRSRDGAYIVWNLK